MSRSLETKFADCITCKHFVSSKCRGCAVGEHFEPDDDDTEEPSEDELMTMYGKMSDDE